MKYSGLILIVALAACNSNEDASKQTSNGTDKRAKAPEPIAVVGCYIGVNNRDTVRLDLTTIDKTVNGNLAYKFFEKDRSDGTFSGEMHGDTLLAEYEFSSEGISSARQVIFLKRGNELVEGYAEMKQEDNRLTFKDISTVDFSRGIVLRRIDCR